MTYKAAKTEAELRQKLTRISTNTLNKLDQTLSEMNANDPYPSEEVPTLGAMQKLVNDEQQRRQDGGSHHSTGRRPRR